MKDFIKKTGAIPLRSIDYRETSRIITAFTEHFGKVQLIAKGVRNPRSKISAAFQNLVHAEIVFYKRETQDIYLVKDASLEDFFEHIHGDLTRFAYASVIADFLFTLLAGEQVSKTLFQYSLFTLRSIDTTSKSDLPSVLAKYLLKGSSIIGFKMQLNVCASCGKENPTPVFFSHDNGGIICGSCQHIDPQASKLEPLLHQFLEKSQLQEQCVHLPNMKHSDYKNLFQLLSNWFYFHNNRILKTLNNHIRGEPFEVYQHPSGEMTGTITDDTIRTIHKEE